MGPSGGLALDPARAAFSRVVRVARTASTNADLVAALRTPGAGAEWPHLSVLVADHQTDGRGRGRRRWETPAGSSLTASIVLRPDVPLDRWSWLSLLTGLATVRSVRSLTGVEAGLKWPNDVVLRGSGATEVPGWGFDRKVAGILVEAVADTGEGPAAIAGLGVNLHQHGKDLPVPWATSLAAAGVPEAGRDGTVLLDTVGVELAQLLTQWRDAAGDAGAAGLHTAVAEACVTLGRQVRVTLPGGREVSGRAAALGPDGSLVLDGTGGGPARVTVGDVDHLRAHTG